MCFTGIFCSGQVPGGEEKVREAGGVSSINGRAILLELAVCLPELGSFVNSWVVLRIAGSQHPTVTVTPTEGMNRLHLLLSLEAAGSTVGWATATGAAASGVSTAGATATVVVSS